MMRARAARVLVVGVVGSSLFVVGLNRSAPLVDAADDATIQISKVTLAPPGAPTPAAFAFTGDITASLAGGQSSTPVLVASDPATPYTVTESVPSNWALTTISCIDTDTGLPTPNASGTVGTATASFNPAPGQHLLCTFTDTQGAIQVNKTTVPSSNPQQFSYTVTGPAGTLTQDNGAPTTSRSFDVAAGAPFTVYGKPGVLYTVVETVPAGWKQSSNSCSAGATPGANSTTTCSFVNTALGGVTVTKSVTGAHAGEAWSFVYTISPAPPGGQTAAITVNGTGAGTATATWTNLDPDTIYTITETAVPGTSAFLSGQISCGGSPVPAVVGVQVQPTPGSTVAPVQCTATNVRSGSISVAKVLVNGTLIAPTDTFSFTVAGGPSAVSIPVNGLGNGATSAPVAPLTPSAYFAADGSLGGTPVPYTVKESDPADPRYRLMSVSCVAGTTVKYVNNGGPFLDPSAVTASIDLLPGEDVVCTFTNDFVDLSIDKVGSANSVTAGAGSTVTYTVAVTNNGTGTPAAQAVVTDSLADFPPEVVFAGTPPANCVYATTRLATCTLPASQLDPGESATVDLVVSVPANTSVAPAGQTFVNSAWVVSLEEPCPGGQPCAPPVCPTNTGWDDDATCEDTDIGPPVADLSIDKMVNGQQGNPTPVPVGDGAATTFTLAVTNTGPSGADGVVITDVIPPGITIAGVVPPPGMTCVLSSSNLTCTLAATLSAGSTLTVTINGHVASGLPNGTVITNTATVVSQTSDENPNNNSDSASVERGIATVTVIKDALGQSGSFTFALTGQSNSSPIGDAGQYTWPNLAPGPYTLSELATAGFRQAAVSCVNLTEGGSAMPPPGTTGPVVLALAADDDVECTFTNETFDLSIDKDDAGVTATAGTSFTYTLTVRNLGTGRAIGTATVVDDLPAGMMWGATQPAGCSAAGQALTCAIPAAELGVGAAATRVVNVDVPAGTAAGSYINNARVTHPDDGNSSNNADTESTPVVAQASLSIVKDTAVSSVAPGATVTYTITVRSLGPSTATSLRVDDALPAALTAVSVTSSFFTCTVTPTVCTAPSLAPGQTQTITVVASVAATGLTNGQSLRNVATVSSSASGSQPTTSTDDATISVVVPAPPTTTTTSLVVPQLPPTGSHPASPAAIGVALLSVGFGAIVLSRRRRPT